MRTGPDEWEARENSTNSEFFPFQTDGDRQESEGISYHDLLEETDLHGSMPRGELHAILLDNQGSDSVYIKHYTAVNSVVPGESINSLFHDSWGGKGLWDGSVISLGGTYEENVSIKASDIDRTISGFSKKLKIVPEKGGVGHIVGI